MRYVSTRGGAPDADFSEVLLRGIAPDGGLYMPAFWPSFDVAELKALPYPDLTRRILKAFVGDSLPACAIDSAVARLIASFSGGEVAPLVELDPGLYLLELFHGPTAAFKDVAMQMMAPLTDAALAARSEQLLLLTATSGDTGAAAVRAFAGAQRVRLVVLHPLNRVSPVQRRQMTTSGSDTVLNLAVRGDFDDCQALIKTLLADAVLRAATLVSSVNSINWGRLAGQIPYYISAAGQTGGEPGFVVPTGNFGDAFAGVAARRLGLKGRLTAAVNANDALARALNGGVYARTLATPTSSVSMDVQAPSNFERLVFEASGRDAQRTAGLFRAFAEHGRVAIDPDLLQALRDEVDAVSVSEEATQDTMREAYARWARVICPHTAVALAAALRRKGGGPIVALATAHPAKFPQAVHRALGFEPQQPPSFAAMADHPERFSVVDADAIAVRAAVERFQRT